MFDPPNGSSHSRKPSHQSQYTSEREWDALPDPGSSSYLSTRQRKKLNNTPSYGLKQTRFKFLGVGERVGVAFIFSGIKEVECEETREQKVGSLWCAADWTAGQNSTLIFILEKEEHSTRVFRSPERIWTSCMSTNIQTIRGTSKVASFPSLLNSHFSVILLPDTWKGRSSNEDTC